MDFSESNLLAVQQNSFKDFHAKGFDYICLQRTPTLTLKAYFFNGDVAKLPEVVNPHDHRYRFTTTVLSGELIDYRFVKGRGGDVYSAFDYRTPLNGGDGFTFRGEERLTKGRGRVIQVGHQLITDYTELHTIQVAQEGTCILLAQYSDELPVDVPTSCFVKRGYPKPDTSGLYSKFTIDEILAYLHRLTPLLKGTNHEI